MNRPDKSYPWTIRTYPTELRQRIVDAVDNKLDAITEIAEMFGVDVRFGHHPYNKK